MPPKNPYLNQATKPPPPKSFDYPCLLTSGVPPPPRPWELKLKKVLKSISYCERKQ